MDAIDPLSGGLRSIRVRDAMVGRSFLSPPWGLEVASDDPCVLVAMLRGEGWVRRGHGAGTHLQEGTVAVLCTQDGPVVVTDEPDGPAQVRVRGPETCDDLALGTSAQVHRTGNRTWGPPDAPASVLVAAYTSDSELFEHLSAGLPPVLQVAADPVVAPVLEALVAETATPAAAQAAVVDRLVEVLLIATVRAWTSRAPASAVGWPSALTDPIVGPALAAVHREPGRRWTVTELARHSGVSRATFARRFRERVGATPSAYLTRWRLALAADLLLDPSENVASVARQVGYADAFSLSAAFTRERGISPSAHRRRARPGLLDHRVERPADAG